MRFDICSCGGGGSTMPGGGYAFPPPLTFSILRILTMALCLRCLSLADARTSCGRVSAKIA